MRFPNGFGGAVTAVTGILGRAATQIIALIVTLLAARFLTPVSFGEYSIAAALVTLSRAMLYAGAFEYLLKAPPGEEAASECLVINLGLAAVLGGALAVLSLFTTPVFHSAEVGVLLLAMAPSSLLSAAANWQESQMLRGGRLKSYYGVTTFAEVIAAVVTVGMILSGFGLVALIVQIYARLSVLTITYRLLQRPAWSSRFSTRRAWRVARWSTARYGATIVAFLSNYSADLLLGLFLSPAATGLYRASHRMVTGVSDLVSNPTRMTAVTIFSRRAAEGLESGPLWPRIAAASAFLGWTALAGLAAVSDPVVTLVLGSRWSAAGPIVAILCLQRGFTLIDVGHGDHQRRPVGGGGALRRRRRGLQQRADRGGVHAHLRGARDAVFRGPASRTAARPTRGDPPCRGRQLGRVRQHAPAAFHRRRRSGRGPSRGRRGRPRLRSGGHGAEKRRHLCVAGVEPSRPQGR